MNNLILGSLVYNEEFRFLDKFLSNMSQLTNKIVIIDDGSTDNSISICSKYTSNIFQTDRLMTKNESVLRQTLWEKCSLLCEDGDYILNPNLTPKQHKHPSECDMDDVAFDIMINNCDTLEDLKEDAKEVIKMIGV